MLTFIDDNSRNLPLDAKTSVTNEAIEHLEVEFATVEVIINYTLKNKTMLYVIMIFHKICANFLQ